MTSRPGRPALRMTLGRWMVAVAALAVVLVLGVPAVRVHEDVASRHHIHSVSADPYFSDWLVYHHETPYWPRYWSALTGRPWSDILPCQRGDGPRR